MFFTRKSLRILYHDCDKNDIVYYAHYVNICTKKLASVLIIRIIRKLYLCQYRLIKLS